MRPLSATPLRTPATAVALVLMVASLCAAPRGAGATGADGSWSRLVDPATAPQRLRHAWIYDPVRDRLLIFGGSWGSPTNGLFSLSLSPTAVWSGLTPSGGGPVPADGQKAVYDPVRDRMIVFGGYHNCDVWALSLAGPLAWSQIQPAGELPPGRVFASIVYDPVRDRLVLFGGYTYINSPPTYPLVYFNDAWALSLAGSPAWTRLSPLGQAPLERAEHDALYDPVRDRMLVYGGATTPYGNGYLGDLWSLSFSGRSTWSALAPSGPLPEGRARAGLAYDPPRDRVLLHGGESAHGVLSDSWELPLASPLAWRPLSTPTAAPALEEFAVAYDPLRDRLIVQGGRGGDGFVEDGTLELTLSGTPSWSRLTPAVPPAAPDPRTGATAVYDSRRHRVIIYGGAVRRNDVDVWAFSPGDFSWTPIVTAGPAPSPRSFASAIYDPVGDRMILVGGQSNLTDTWALSFDPTPAWTQLPPRPVSGDQAAAAYDPVRQRMIVSGGYQSGISDGSTSTREVWALSLTGSPAWTALPPHPSAVGIFAHSMVYDPVRDRLLTIGGSTKSSGSIIVHTLDRRVFALPLAPGSQWSELPTSGSASTRGFTTVYDPARDRLLLLGSASWTGSDPSRTVWARPAGDAGDWTELAATGAQPSLQFVAGVFDPARDQVVELLTAQDPSVEDQDQAWTLAFSGVLDAPRPGGTGLSLARPWPDPSPGMAFTAVTLPDGTPAKLELLDLSGRRIWSREVGTLGAGSHVVRLGATPLSPGLYFVRLARGGDSLTARLAVLR